MTTQDHFRAACMQEALEEIVRAVKAWDNDEDFGMDTDLERPFDCDADFAWYAGQIAREALESAKDPA